MEARATSGGCVIAGTSEDRVKPPKFDGSASWEVFHRQFEAAADHKWTSCEKVAHLLTLLQGQAADGVHSAPAERHTRTSSGLWRRLPLPKENTSYGSTSDSVPVIGGSSLVFPKSASRWPNSLKRSGLTNGPRRETPLSDPWKSRCVRRSPWVTRGRVRSSSWTQIQVASELNVYCHKHRKAISEFCLSSARPYPGRK
jgi:hypothetical protein